MSENVQVRFGSHYICDSFPTWDAAEAFADDVAEQLGLSVWVSRSPSAAHQHEPFVYEQYPVICHVTRPRDWADDADAEFVRETKVELLADFWGGQYIGT